MPPSWEARLASAAAGQTRERILAEVEAELPQVRHVAINRALSEMKEGITGAVKGNPSDHFTGSRHMKLDWLIEQSDTEKVQSLIAKHEDDPFVKRRYALNVRDDMPKVGRSRICPSSPVTKARPNEWETVSETTSRLGRPKRTRPNPSAPRVRNMPTTPEAR